MSDTFEMQPGSFVQTEASTVYSSSLSREMFREAWRAYIWRQDKFIGKFDADQVYRECLASAKIVEMIEADDEAEEEG